MLRILKNSKFKWLLLIGLILIILVSLVNFSKSNKPYIVEFEYLEPDKVQITTTGKGSVTLYIEQFELYYKSNDERKKINKKKTNMSYDILMVKDETTDIYSLDDLWDIYVDDNLELVIYYVTDKGMPEKKVIKYKKVEIDL